MSPETYVVFAIRYAARTLQRRTAFLGGDPHDGPMPMDYFVWLARSPQRSIVIDVGFSAEAGGRRGRTYFRSPRDGLALLGVDAETVRDVIVTHLHWDHVGCFDQFPAAQFHLQDDEMAYATGRYMRIPQMSRGYEVEDVVGMVRLTYKSRVTFYNGTAEFAPGISLHRIGGHTKGQQCVRIFTRRGWMVLASDAAHYYEEVEQDRIYGSVFNVGEMIDGYATLRQLAGSTDRVIPGHDPDVMQRYPAAAAELEGIAVRLDADPIVADHQSTS